ncbi:MAG TPA: ABC transporter substrate-binding protein [Thermoanaerobaculia bacterium]
MSSRRFAALFALLLCLGCDRSERPADTPAAAAPKRPPVADGRPQDGGTLIRRFESEVSSLNPVLNSTIYERQVDEYLYTPLVHLDQDLQPIPGLADSWDIEEGGKLYRFHLNKKATFSDGTPVKASDLLFTLRKVVDPASEAVQTASAFEYLDIARTRAVDDHTIEIAFRQPLASQLIRFHDILVLPEHVYSKGDFRKDYNDIAVGSGPYRLIKRERGKETSGSPHEVVASWDRGQIDNLLDQVVAAIDDPDVSYAVHIDHIDVSGDTILGDKSGDVVHGDKHVY